MFSLMDLKFLTTTNLILSILIFSQPGVCGENKQEQDCVQNRIIVDSERTSIVQLCKPNGRGNFELNATLSWLSITRNGVLTLSPGSEDKGEYEFAFRYFTLITTPEKTVRQVQVRDHLIVEVK